MNDELTRETRKHKQRSWRPHVETLDHKSDPTKLWRTLKAIDSKAPSSAENKAIFFNGYQVSSPTDIANTFNQQFTTSKLGIHKSSRDTRKTVRATKRKSLTDATQFSTEEVKKAIKGCSNSKAFGPDKLSIFHLKHLGPKGIEFLTTIYNSSYSGCRIPAIWKKSIVIPNPKPGKDTSQLGHLLLTYFTDLPSCLSYGGSHTFNN